MSSPYLSAAAFALGSILLSKVLRRNSRKTNVPKGQPVKSSYSIDDEVNNVLKLPCINLDAFFKKDIDKVAYLAECAKVAAALHKYGVCVVKDPRVAEVDNHNFLNMMER